MFGQPEKKTSPGLFFSIQPVESTAYPPLIPITLNHQKKHRIGCGSHAHLSV